MKPELAEKVVKFVSLAGQISEKSAALAASYNGKLQKCAAAAPGLVERCIELGLIDKHQVKEAETLFADPSELVGIVDNILVKYAQEKSARVKMAGMTQGSGEAEERERTKFAGVSPFVGKKHGQPSEADDNFAEAILANV